MILRGENNAFIEGKTLNMKTDYETYEEACEAIREENARMLELFEASMANLKPQTIRRHLSNVDFYINDYLLYYEALSFRDGVWEVAGFLGDFFIRKCMWSTPASIKSTAASIKKFYKCMMDNDMIPKEHYAQLCETIKEDMEDWQETCAIYNDPEEETPFFMW